LPVPFHCEERLSIWVREGDQSKRNNVCERLFKELLEKGWGMVQVVEHLPGKPKAPSSNPSTAKRKTLWRILAYKKLKTFIKID
jgi:hypothetical protein